MSDRRSNAESGEGAEESSSQGPRRPSDPLHPSPPQHSYYSQQSPYLPYPPSSTREGISAYATYRRSGAPPPSLHAYPPPGYPHGHGHRPPVDPRAAAQQVTPDSRQQPIPSEFMSPPSSVRRRHAAPSPAPSSSRPSTKRPRRTGTGTFFEPNRVQVSMCSFFRSVWSIHHVASSFELCLIGNKTTFPPAASNFSVGTRFGARFYCILSTL